MQNQAEKPEIWLHANPSGSPAGVLVGVVEEVYSVREYWHLNKGAICILNHLFGFQDRSHSVQCDG